MNKQSCTCKQKENDLGFVISFIAGTFFLISILAFLKSISFLNLTFLDDTLPKETVSQHFERVEFKVDSINFNQEKNYYDIVIKSGLFLSRFSCNVKPSESLTLLAYADLYEYKSISGNISYEAKPYRPFCLYINSKK